VQYAGHNLNLLSAVSHDAIHNPQANSIWGSADELDLPVGVNNIVLTGAANTQWAMVVVVIKDIALSTPLFADTWADGFGASAGGSVGAEADTLALALCRNNQGAIGVIPGSGVSVAYDEPGAEVFYRSGVNPSVLLDWTYAASTEWSTFLLSVRGGGGAPGDVTGGVAATESRDSAAFSGAKTFFGSIAATEQRDTAAFAGTMIPKFVTGTVGATEQRDVAAIVGDTTDPNQITGGMAATEFRDTAAFSGAKTFFGSIAATEQRDTAAFAGTMIPKFVTGTIGATEQRDTAAITGDTFQPGQIAGSIQATESRDSAAFAGAKTFVGNLLAMEARDTAAFNGMMAKIHSGTLAVTEARDIARIDGKAPEDNVANDIAMRDGNTGIGVSVQAEWKDGAPRNNDGTNIPTAIGQAPAPDNAQNQAAVVRQTRLIQAPADTPAGTDIIPGWFAYVDVKAGQWQWCISRTTSVADADNPIGMVDVP
jgi:hypothetical protein